MVSSPCNTGRRTLAAAPFLPTIMIVGTVVVEEPVELE
jgi:hypothetical protein